MLKFNEILTIYTQYDILKLNKIFDGDIMKKKTIIIIVVAVLVVVLVGGGVVFYFKDVWFGNYGDSELGRYYGLFGYAPLTGKESLYIDYSDRIQEFTHEIELGMQDDATDEQKALAAYIIYRIGCLADATALMRAKYTIGSGTATGNIEFKKSGLDVSGGMDVTATYYDLKYPLKIPSSVDEIYKSYQFYGASEEYTQVPAQAITGSNESLVTLGEPLLRASLPFARRTIYTPEHICVWEGDPKSCVISPEKATADFSIKDKSFNKKTQSQVLESEMEAGFRREYGEEWGDIYGLTSRDFSIHIINPDTIKGETVVITKKTGKDIKYNDIDYYSVEFEVDTQKNRGTELSATYYAEKFYQAQAPEAFISFLKDYNLYYDYLKIKMTVFENGYFRTWSTDETWIMSGNVMNLAFAELVSTNESEEAFCYDYNTIMQGFRNRYYGDIKEVNMPISKLPFYKSHLSEFKPQAYGSYR